MRIAGLRAPNSAAAASSGSDGASGEGTRDFGSRLIEHAVEEGEHPSVRASRTGSFWSGSALGVADRLPRSARRRECASEPPEDAAVELPRDLGEVGSG